MSKLKVGIIGAGQIAETVHIANYQKYPEEVEVTAIVDTIPEKARAIAEKYNILTVNTGVFPQTSSEPENPYFSMFCDIDMEKYNENPMPQLL